MRVYLNVDVKIACREIAARIIIKVLPGIIHTNQDGYVMGRFIGEAARSIIDVFETKKYIQGILLFIDFEGFDSIDWNFVLKCIDAFGFWPSLIRWVETFYKDITSQCIK